MWRGGTSGCSSKKEWQRGGGGIGCGACSQLARVELGRRGGLKQKKRGKGGDRDRRERKRR